MTLREVESIKDCAFGTDLWKRDCVNTVASILQGMFRGISSSLSMSRGGLHHMLQSEVFDLARKFGLEGRGEYPVEYSNPCAKRGLIDVVWLSYERPVAAFEIDSSPRLKSLKKLLAIPAPLKIWVLYMKRERQNRVLRNEIHPSIIRIKIS
jgi:hypothetical protein